MIPVAGSIETETDVRYGAVNAGFILGKMEESRNRTNIFILDACRNNPFRGFRSMSKGLSMMDAPVGTFIAYATAPGSVAADGSDRNSPYAKHLVQAIKNKGVTIEQVFKQVLREVRKETGGKQIPWTASSLQDDFYFCPSAPAVVHGPPQPEPTRPTIASIPAPSPVSDCRATADRLAALACTRSDRSSWDGLNRMCNDSQAVKWFRRAAEQGDQLAQLMVGRMHFFGIGVAKDRREGIKWFRKSAEQGNPLAQNYLGSVYKGGYTGTVDYAEAVKWYQKSVDQGCALAQNGLGWLYFFGDGVAKDYAEAIKWFRRSADQGNACGQNSLGTMYSMGTGVAEDQVEAVKWHTRAADQGDSGGQYNLGICYMYGKGVPEDRQEAIRWFREAAAQGNEDAKGRLKQLGETVLK